MIPTSTLDEPGRLKALLYGGAGVGKTTAAVQMPRPYVIDTEKGAVHYGEIIKRNEGAVYHTNSLREIVKIVRALATEQHDYLTLVIDPVTTIWKYAVDEAEARVGSQYGRRIAEAKKLVTQLENYMSQIDMNVVCTSRAKDNFSTERQTVDAWKGLDYFFDVVIEIEREDDRRRFARVEKSRIVRIEEMSRWPWSYSELASRFGREDLERGVTPLTLEESASSEALAAKESARRVLANLSAVAAEHQHELSERQREYVIELLRSECATAADWEQVEATAQTVIDRLVGTDTDRVLDLAERKGA